MKRIYIADDEEDILLLLQCFLKKEGYHVEVFGTGEALLERFQEEEADLLIVDIMIAGDGWLPGLKQDKGGIGSTHHYFDRKRFRCRSDHGIYQGL